MRGNKVEAVYKWHNPANEIYVNIFVGGFADKRVKRQDYTVKKQIYYTNLRSEEVADSYNGR